MNSTERHATVESLAHDLWISRGSPIGSPEIDWLEAERRLEASGAGAQVTEATIVGNALHRWTAGSDGAFSEETKEGSDRRAESVVSDDEDTQVNRMPSAPSSPDDLNAERTNESPLLQKSSRRR